METESTSVPHGTQKAAGDTAFLKATHNSFQQHHGIIKKITQLWLEESSMWSICCILREVFSKKVEFFLVLNISHNIKTNDRWSE